MPEEQETPVGVKVVSFLLFLGGFAGLFLSIGLGASSLSLMIPIALLSIGSFVAGAKLLRRERNGWITAQAIFVLSFLLDAWMITKGNTSIVRMAATLLIIIYLYNEKDLFLEEKG